MSSLSAKRYTGSSTHNSDTSCAFNQSSWLSCHTMCVCHVQMKRSSLQILCDLCESRVINTDGHLGHICSCVLETADRPRVTQFIRQYLHRNQREIPAPKLLYKIYNEVAEVSYLPEGGLLRTMVVLLEDVGQQLGNAGAHNYCRRHSSCTAVSRS